MKDQALNRIQFDHNLRGGFSNREASAKLPAILPQPLLLNLGCGNDIREQFLNIDLYSDDPRVIYGDIRKLDLSDNSADLILASDVLEHFSHREISEILKEWNRVLKPNGEIIIRCPSLKLQVQAYIRGDWDADIASYMIFGGQTNPGDYHCVAFDDKSIVKHLKSAGFDNIEIEEHDFPQSNGFINLNMTVKAIKKLDEKTGITNIEQIEDALLGLEGDKENSSDSDFPDLDNIGLEIDDLNNTNSKDNELDGFDFEIDNDSSIKETDIDLLAEIVEGESNDNLEHIDDNIEEENEVKLNVVWEGSQFLYHSLALINREHCINLLNSSEINLNIVPYEKETFDPRENPRYQALAENDIRIKKEVDKEISKKPYLWIRHQWPPKAEAPKGAKWVIMQPWEFSRLRQDFAELFKQTDELWTPSYFSKNSFINSGIDESKIKVIPNGINRDLFKPNGNKFKLGTNKNFKILFVGGTIYRKGIDILLKVYSNLFNINHDACLVIKDMGGDSFYKGQTAEEMINEIKSKDNAPEIIHISHDLSEEEMASLYRACDIFVSPYRGEGFSLPTLEAMACGLPVAVTEGGASDDFVDETIGYLIEAEEKSIGKELNGVPFTEEAYLLEPNPKSLAQILKVAFENPGALKLSGILGQLRARKDWTWNNATLKIFNRIDDLYGLNISKNVLSKLKLEDDSLIIFGKAENYYQLGNYYKAKELFQKAAEADDLHDEYSIHALLRLAILEINNEDYEKAITLIKNAETINKEHPDVQYLRAIYHSSKTENTEALETLTPLLDNWHSIKYESSFGINLDDVVVLTADLILEQGDLEGAHNLYSKALKLNPENPYACYGAGRCFKFAELNDKAREMFEWALKLDPNLEAARRELASLNMN